MIFYVPTSRMLQISFNTVNLCFEIDLFIGYCYIQGLDIIIDGDYLNVKLIEKAQLDERELQKIEKFFLKLGRKKELAKRTKTNYITALKNFKTFLQLHTTKHTIFESDVPDFDAYVDFLMRNYERNSSTIYSWNVRTFLLYLFPEEEQHYMKVQLPTRGRNKLKAEDIITYEEILQMIEKTPYVRDKAIIAFLVDTGTRRGELPYIQLKHLKDEGTHIEVHIPKSKTMAGIRTVYLRSACGYIRNWLNIHPRRNDPNAPLFCNLRKPYGLINPKRIYEIVIKAAEEANIEKNIYTHLTRHYFTTKALVTYSEAVVKKLRGDTKRSRIIDEYSHLVQSDVGTAWKRQQGIETNDIDEPKFFEPIICPQCQFVNQPTCIFCGRCGLALSDETIFKQKQKKPMEILSKLLKFLSEKLDSEIIEELLKESQ